MGYRQDTRQVLCDVPESTELHVLNGASVEYAFPCLYAIPSDTDDDHVEYEKIHLAAEGYGAPTILFDDVPEGLTFNAWIDEVEDHVVRLVVSAQCPSAVDRDATCPMSVTIQRSAEPHGTRTDVVLRSKVVVEAAPLYGAVLPT